MDAVRIEVDSMTEPELKKLFDLYNDLWKMTREHHRAKTEEEYTALTDRAAELVEKYGAETRSIVLDALELIERRIEK